MFIPESRKSALVEEREARENLAPGVEVPIPNRVLVVSTEILALLERVDAPVQKATVLAAPPESDPAHWSSGPIRHPEVSRMPLAKVEVPVPPTFIIPEVWILPEVVVATPTPNPPKA